jgi:hypothetical protein
MALGRQVALADLFAGAQCSCEQKSGKKAAWRELCPIVRHLGSEISRNGNKHALPFFEIAFVLVRRDHVARVIVNSNGVI